MMKKSLITMGLVLAAVLGNYISAHALSFSGTSTNLTVTACNPDRYPANPFACSIHENLKEKGGFPGATVVIQGTITVPLGAGLLICKNNGGNSTVPGVGGTTLINSVNGANVIPTEKGHFQTEHRYLNHIDEFNGNVVEFRRTWGLPLDRTLCRSDTWTELLYIPKELFVTGAIFSECTNTDDTTTCELDATIQGLCKIVGKVTPETPSWEYDCKDIVVNNKP